MIDKCKSNPTKEHCLGYKGLSLGYEPACCYCGKPTPFDVVLKYGRDRLAAA